jgi:hypothetical protein
VRLHEKTGNDLHHLRISKPHFSFDVGPAHRLGALPPNNSMELTGQMRHVPCEEKSKGHAAFVLQLMHER